MAHYYCRCLRLCSGTPKQPASISSPYSCRFVGSSLGNTLLPRVIDLASFSELWENIYQAPGCGELFEDGPNLEAAVDRKRSRAELQAGAAGNSSGTATNDPFRVRQMGNGDLHQQWPGQVQRTAGEDREASRSPPVRRPPSGREELYQLVSIATTREAYGIPFFHVLAPARTRCSCFASHSLLHCNCRRWPNLRRYTHTLQSLPNELHAVLTHNSLDDCSTFSTWEPLSSMDPMQLKAEVGSVPSRAPVGLNCIFSSPRFIGFVRCDFLDRPSGWGPCVILAAHTQGSQTH